MWNCYSVKLRDVNDNIYNVGVSTDSEYHAIESAKKSIFDSKRLATEFISINTVNVI